MPKTAVSLRDFVSRMYEKNIEATILGIGPMSKVVMIAALELGRDMDFPVLFIASRNQIDSHKFGGGYVMGWDQKQFADAIRQIADDVGFDGLLYLCRDHGGPWQRDKEKNSKLPPDEAMEIAKQSYLEDIEAGFNLLHIDPTKDPHCADGPVAMDMVIERTLELIEFTEGKVKELNLPPVSYEIGTEETAGGLISPEAFEKFIADLLAELDKRNLSHPAFIVGQTGTLVKMDQNVGTFDAESAKQLCEIAKKYNIGFKEHNADYLPLDILKHHPELGITGANVAPEYGLVETRALISLAEKEAEAIANKKDLTPSGFKKVIQKAALDCKRWKKWLLKEDEGLTGEDIAGNREKLDDVTSVCGHYVFEVDEVKASRKRLYDNVKTLGIAESPERVLVDAVKDSIMSYVNAFNMKGISNKVL
ncbi:sugar-phosphate kinase [Candidatus Poribacteria bacterium]|nr:sugar-phosphate kinase [Candidatus Poribacteria bacterium]